MKYLLAILCIFLLISDCLSETEGFFDKNKKDDDDDIDFVSILRDFTGQWVGNGVTMIALPSQDTTNKLDFELMVFHTQESITFSAVHEGIRNAGDTKDTTNFLSAVTYYQQVTDINTRKELHVEPGSWFAQPEIDNQPQLLWRAGIVPHGNSFLAGSEEVTVAKKGPVFEEIDTTPFNQGKEDEKKGGGYIAFYSDATKVPESLGKYSSAGNFVLNPTLVLEKDNEGLNIVKTKTITISSIVDGPSFGGLLNIPTLNPDISAHAAQIEATFYIEKIKEKDGSIWHQLQYVQEIYLDFPVNQAKAKADGKIPQIITWPHVSVATLRKQSGFPDTK